LALRGLIDGRSRQLKPRFSFLMKPASTGNAIIVLTFTRLRDTLRPRYGDSVRFTPLTRTRAIAKSPSDRNRPLNNFRFHPFKVAVTKRHRFCNFDRFPRAREARISLLSNSRVPLSLSLSFSRSATAVSSHESRFFRRRNYLFRGCAPRVLARTLFINRSSNVPPSLPASSPLLLFRPKRIFPATL